VEIFKAAVCKTDFGGYLLCSDNVRMSSRVANSSTHFVAIGHEDVGKRPALARASKCEAL
jgi:hypothetical protein